LALLIGENISANEKKSVKYLRKAAKSGVGIAQMVLADCYYDGCGVFANKMKAFDWYKKAAEQGEARAQFYLGFFYYYGDKIPINKDIALKWFEKSAKQEDKKAKVMLGYIKQPFHEKIYTIINKFYKISKNRFLFFKKELTTKKHSIKKLNIFVVVAKFGRFYITLYNLNIWTKIFAIIGFLIIIILIIGYIICGFSFNQINQNIILKHLYLVALMSLITAFFFLIKKNIIKEIMRY